MNSYLVSSPGSWTDSQFGHLTPQLLSLSCLGKNTYKEQGETKQVSQIHLVTPYTAFIVECVQTTEEGEDTETYDGFGSSFTLDM